MATGRSEGQVSMSIARVREGIRELEIGVANLGGRGAKALDLLRLRSQVEASMVEREAAGVDAHSEKTRLQTIDSVFAREAQAIVRAARASGGLEKAREAEHPPESHWWWYLDSRVAEDRRKQLIRTGSIVAGAAIIILVAFFVMNRLSGTSSAEKRARELVATGEQALRSGEYDKAITAYSEAVAAMPSLAEAHVALAVLYDLEGRTAESEQSLATARGLMADEGGFLTTVARTYGDAGAYEKGLTYADQAVALDPESALAHLIRGGIYEAAGDRAGALTDLQRAVDLAQANGEDELLVLAKTRLGMFSQQAPADFGSPSPTPS